ncbi:MAG: hypothetical protein CMJ81_06095 [Planctomycetaceae bacterium]|nr:hypothetical protein [Planctomycetaceae bacterium]
MLSRSGISADPQNKKNRMTTAADRKPGSLKARSQAPLHRQNTKHDLQAVVYALSVARQVESKQDDRVLLRRPSSLTGMMLNPGA